MAITEEERDHLYILFHGSHGLRVCGCGSPEDAWKLVLDPLEATAACYDDEGQFEGWQHEGQHPYDRLCGNSGAAHIVLGALEETGLVEHGGSFYGSWLTETGRVYLGLMRDCGPGDLDDAGCPHDGGGCPAACPYRLAWTGSEER